jgi:uracil-DNA glycosylase
MTPNQSKAARELLAFYLEAGVDTPMGEAAVDRFADDAAMKRQPPVASPLAGEADPRSGSAGGLVRQSSRSQLPPSPPRPDKGGGSSEISLPLTGMSAAPPSPDAATLSAREAARSAKTLDELRAALESFEGCALKNTATQLVFADGNPKARVMFVGEAPGRDEDIEGLPFVGRSGKLLDRMLAAIGLDRTNVYIANIVPWRPPGNRTPTPQESQICLPFIQRQIELVDPDILVCLGGPATQTLLGVRDGITKTRGRWFTYDTGKREIRALPTFHPAFLLRSPLQKRLAWRDFLAIKKALAG